VLSNRAIWLFLASQALVMAQTVPDTTWKPYTAVYTETVTTDRGAGQHTVKQTVLHEKRSASGALLTEREVDGKLTSGRLWTAAGQVYELNYDSKRASLVRQGVKKHFHKPATPATGERVIAGVRCESYPIRAAPGDAPESGGEYCVDISRDIVALQELRIIRKAGGGKIFDGQQSIKQLVSIDTTTPVEESQLVMPEGFAVAGQN